MEIATYATVALTLALVVMRPKVGGRMRVTPATAALGGVAILLALGVVTLPIVRAAAENLWSPFVAIASIMVLTEVAGRIGLLDAWAAGVSARAVTTTQLFGRIFALGVLTSVTLSNDAAILLLTPLVVVLVRRRYPERPELVVPFAFAVFMSAGVAALPVSNPMNMVVADVYGIAFGTYVTRMAPAAIVCWLISFLVLRLLFRTVLREGSPPAPEAVPAPWTTVQWRMMALLAAVLVSYPIIGYVGGPIWAVAATGAALALLNARASVDRGPLRIIAQGVSWDTLGFLAGVLILSMGLKEVGLVDRLAELYQEAGVALVGVGSALGSALLNNHPMAHLNMISLRQAGAPETTVLAALVGGDLGPRLLPMGSLAGLMWLALLRRQGVTISIRTFFVVGLLVTVPCLAAALATLSLF